MGTKKHKKHKSEKKDRYEDKSDKPPGLKLILKVGSSSTPEHSSDSVPPVHGHGSYSVAGDEESRQSAASLHGREETHADRQHRKAKKKKKKKEKDKDKDKHEKKHKHHHKEKRKRPRDESSQDDVSMGEESLSDPPQPSKRMMMEGSGDSAQGPGSNPGTGDGMHVHQGQVCATVSREPRSCVLRQRQERSPLQKLLDHLLKGLEKRDPQQFFAWPVTDHIAPGYSQIIQQPMDFSTMKQKIDDNSYATLNDFIEDFKLMCNNAMVYNHPETIYYKAAKKLLHVGTKMMTPEKLKPLRSVVTYLSEISREELGFDLGFEDASMANVSKVEPMEEGGNLDEEGDDASSEQRREHRRKLKESRPLGKFEAIPDDLTPEEILEQAQNAAKAAAEKLSLKKMSTKMGFLRQNKDGTTSLSILIPTDGVIPGSNERPISLGQLSGKLSHGTGQLQGFREDRRNLAKTVKPLYYGAFGSYAPSYDSTFANLTKEESDLVYQTYGDETSVQYAESILDFAKDCDYTLTMVDNLLDLLTNGEHRKTKKVLEERKRLREEEERVRQMLEEKPSPPASDVKIDFGCLKSLNDIGLDVKFLEDIEQHLNPGDEQQPGNEAMQTQLEQTSNLLQKLQQVQNDRLSLPPPPHLSQVPHPSDNEIQLAEKITENLKDMAKKVQPMGVVSVPAIRKVMGIMPEGSDTSSPGGEVIIDSEVEGSDVVVMLNGDQTGDEVDVEGTSSQAEADDDSAAEGGVGPVPDLESELREFLESGPTISNSPLQDDKTIEEILSES